MINEQSIQRMRNELNLLRWYVLVLTSVIAILWFAGFRQHCIKEMNSPSGE
jgi:hypothetical protein